MSLELKEAIWPQHAFVNVFFFFLLLPQVPGKLICVFGIRLLIFIPSILMLLSPSSRVRTRTALVKNSAGICKLPHML